MGHSTAEGFASAADDGLTSLRTAISLNLTTNHYPPIPSAYVGPVVAAVEAVNEDEPERAIDITDVARESGMEPSLADKVDGRLVVAASTLLSITHSWPFVSEDDPYLLEHPEDCLYCAAGEPMEHDYEPPKDDPSTLGCITCGDDVFVTEEGTAHHWLGDGVDYIDHDKDADHVALPDA